MLTRWWQVYKLASDKLEELEKLVDQPCDDDHHSHSHAHSHAHSHHSDHDHDSHAHSHHSDHSDHDHHSVHDHDHASAPPCAEDHHTSPSSHCNDDDVCPSPLGSVVSARLGAWDDIASVINLGTVDDNPSVGTAEPPERLGTFGGLSVDGEALEERERFLAEQTPGHAGPASPQPMGATPLPMPAVASPAPLPIPGPPPATLEAEEAFAAMAAGAPDADKPAAPTPVDKECIVSLAVV